MSSQDGPIVLVTGASSGIGRALSEMLLDRGASVLGVTRRPAALPAGVAPIQADLTQREEIQDLFQHLGRINALVNCSVWLRGALSVFSRAAVSATSRATACRCRAPSCCATPPSLPNSRPTARPTCRICRGCSNGFLLPPRRKRPLP